MSIPQKSLFCYLCAKDVHNWSKFDKVLTKNKCNAQFFLRHGVVCVVVIIVVAASATIVTLCLKIFRTPVIFSNNSNKSGPMLITFGRENRQ